MENDNFSAGVQATNSYTNTAQPHTTRDWQDAVTIGVLIGGTALIGIILSFRTQINLGSSQSNVTVQPAQASSQANTQTSNLSRQDAANLISRWLSAKRTIFASPFDRQLAGEVTTGALQKDILKTNGSIDWLKSNNAYYKFGIQKVGNIENISLKRTDASISATVTEDRALYINGKVDHQQTSYDTRIVKYTLKFSDGEWKISDYKTIKILN